MPIYKRGDSFLVSVGSGANRYRESFKTQEDAEKALNEALQGKRGAGKGNVPTTSEKTLRDAFDLTWRLRWSQDKSASTHKINAQSNLKAFGEDTKLSEITTESITEVIFEWEDQGNSGSTINRKISNLSTMLTMAADQGWLEKLPKFPRRKEGKHRIRWLSDEEETRVLTTARHLGLDSLADFITVAVDTGFRKAELLGLEPRDFFNGQLHLHAGQTKNDDARSVPATTRVKNILADRMGSRRIFDDLTAATIRYQWDVLKTSLKMSDDPQFVVHMLRHTCASRLVQRGVPLAVVQRWMGHKNIQTTLRYAHLAPENLMEAMEKLEGTLAEQKPVLKVVTGTT
jgi:integrase